MGVEEAGAATHEELHGLLSAYAAGALDELRAATVRAHVAGGCRGCLDELFASRTMTPSVRNGRPMDLATTALPRARRRMAVVLVGLLAIGFAAGWLSGVRAGAAADHARRETPLDAMVAEHAALRARLASAEGAARDALRRLSATDDAAVETVALDEERARLDEEAQKLRVALRRRESQLAALRGRAGTALELLALPDTALLALAPVPPFREARGHVLWNAARAQALLHAFGLPPAERYLVRVTGDAGRLPVLGPVLVPDAAGTTTSVLPRVDAAGELHAVELLLEPVGRPVVAWRR